MEWNEVVKLLAYPSDIVVISHRNPDGDAIGSAWALKGYLEKKGHQVKVIFPSDYPEVYDFMPGLNQSIIYDRDSISGLDYLKKANIVFLVDFNSLDRIDKVGIEVSKLSVPTIMIDHHIDPEPSADYMLWDTSASSTAELVFQFLNDWDGLREMDMTIAEFLYIGLLTDTGSFSYATTNKTFQVAAKLLEHGVDNFYMHDMLYNAYTEKQLRLLGYSLHDRMELLPDLKAGVISLSKEDFKKFNIQRGDTEGIVNYILSIKGIQIAAFITEQPGIIKYSFRSKGDFSVQQLATKHFRGGGHKNASGGYDHFSLERAVKKFKKVLRLELGIPNIETEKRED